jgi:hypothetical protein
MGDRHLQMPVKWAETHLTRTVQIDEGTVTKLLQTRNCVLSLEL